MKKILLPLLLLTFISFASFSQKKEKIKGDKHVTTVTKNIEKGFTAIEIADGLKVNIIKSSQNSYTLTTDNNLQDIVQFTVSQGLLKIHTTSNIVRSKKLDITVNFRNLEYVILNDKSELKSSKSIEGNNINITAKNSSKFDLEIKSNRATITMQNDAQGKLNLRSDEITIVMNDKTKLNANLNAGATTASLSKNAKLELNGKSERAAFVLIDSSKLDAKRIKISSANVSTADKSELHIDAKRNVEIQAKDKSKIFVYSDSNIEIKKFGGKAEVLKR